MAGNTNENGAIRRTRICNCRDRQRKRGEALGLVSCRNADHEDDARPMRHPRLADDGEAIASVPTVAGRVDHRALGLLDAHSDFDRSAFAWVGSEDLGDGVFSASVYAGTAADSPYLWITDPIQVIAKTGVRVGESKPEEGGREQFLICLFVGDADGEVEQPDPFLVCECGPEKLAAESLRMLEAARGLFQ
jgi:hypothetical protein